MGEERGDIEQLFEPLGPDDTSLVKEGIDDPVARGQRSSMRRGGARARGGAARLDRDDWFRTRDPACNLAELLRVTKALEVEQDHGRSGVVSPILNQVVSGHVGLVPDGHEARDADVEALRIIEDGQAERPALRGHRDGSGGWIHRRERRVQPHLRVGIQQAHAVGTDQAAAGAADALDQRAPLGHVLRHRIR